ncbi:MAG: glycosyltransferase [Phycisphaerales bacterium]
MYSFIIPAHNEEKLLPRTLRAIHDAAKVLAGPYEIIVANDASTDTTEQVALQHGARVVNVDHRQISKTRNSGAAEAQGDIFVFVDADTFVNDALLKSMHNRLQNGIVGGGAVVALGGNLPLYGRVFGPIFTFIYSRAGFAAGCFIFCKRDAFQAINGFDETLFAGEELEFTRQMRRQGKFKILREPVVTSGRKLRTHTARELASTVFGFMLQGPKALKSRDKLDMWYGERREDTEV